MTIKGACANFLKAASNNKAFFYLQTGAARTGKTLSTALIFRDKILECAKEDKIILGSQSHMTLNNIVLDSLTQVDPKLNIHKRADGTIFIEGRACLPYTYTDKDLGKKKQGGTIRLAWFDEAHSCRQQIFNDTVPRLSLHDSQFYITSNPEGSQHWIYQNFIADAKRIDLSNSYVYKKKFGTDRYSLVFPSSMDEYRISKGGHIDDGYVDMLINFLPKTEVRRLVYGEHIDAVGKVFDKSVLKFYEGDINPSYSLYAVIDPAFGQENCFSSCIVFQNINGTIYLIDAGMLRSDSINTTDEVIASFLNQYDLKTIFVESVFAQKELIKRLQRTFKGVQGFVPKGKKTERIAATQISIRDKVQFPIEWSILPKDKEWTSTKHGRGYLGLMQLLNFSMDEKENCIKGDDFSYVDFPDALASVLQIFNLTETPRETLSQQQPIFNPFDMASRRRSEFV